MSLSRWPTGTKAETLIALRKGGAQLYPQLSDLISKIEDEYDVRNWDVAILECRICGYKHLAVVPSEMDDDDNECQNCGNMTADVVEEA